MRVWPGSLRAAIRAAGGAFGVALDQVGAAELDFDRAYPVDRILAVFRANAGLDTRGARPPGGSETADGNLRGHFGGHGGNARVDRAREFLPDQLLQ